MQLGAILVVVIIIGAIFFYVSPSYAPSIQVTSPGPFDLSKDSTVIPSEKAISLVRDPESTFQAFVYLNPLMRTGTYGTCGPNPNQPSCSDGSFAACPCDAATGDCKGCIHEGYRQVFNLNGVAALEVLSIPDASRQGQAMAQMIVKTEGPSLSGATSSQKYIETLSLPPIQFQKWTMITVSREGRRFDIYYNTDLVLSKTCTYMPVTNPLNTTFNGVKSGATGLGGILMNASVSSSRTSVQKIKEDYQRLADTRGQPYVVSDPNAPLKTLSTDLSSNLDPLGLNPTVSEGGGGSWFPTISLSKLFCPSGNCISAPTVRPANPLYDWSSAYA